MYVHVTAKSLDGTLLFHDWTEALALWRRLLGAFPDAKAICLMPNHPHVLADPDQARERLSSVMSGYARWRAHRRGGGPACWQPQPPVEILPDAAHLRRMVRYVALNPCRAGLAKDPLAWPLSLHRDFVGFGDPARRNREPASVHAYVSSDRSVSVVGTALPELRAGRASLDEVATAVGAILRLSPIEVTRLPAARRLCARAAWVRQNQDTTALAAWLEMTRARIYQLVGDLPAELSLGRQGQLEPQLFAVLRAIGDPRFRALTPPRGNPTRWSAWRMG